METTIIAKGVCIVNNGKENGNNYGGRSPFLAPTSDSLRALKYPSATCCGWVGTNNTLKPTSKAEP